LALIDMPDNVMDMLGRFDAQVFFRAQDGEDLKGVGIHDIDRRRAVLYWIQRLPTTASQRLSHSIKSIPQGQERVARRGR